MAKIKKKPFKSKIKSLLLMLVGFLLVCGAFIGGLKYVSTPFMVTGSDDVTVFITSLAPEAQKLYKEKGLLPSIVIAQAALESDWGRSELSQTYYNLYGIKTTQSDTSHIRLKTDEFIQNNWFESKETFKVYDSWASSMEDYATLLTFSNPTLYKEVVQATNYEEAATALQVAGYATDPNYSKKLVAIIEANDLFNYDNVHEN